MLLKLGVSITDLKPAVRRRLTTIDQAFIRSTGAEAVLTSTNEGTHMAGSLHYANLAVDIRRPAEPARILKELQADLGEEFDIVVEADHFHIEYDPHPKK